MEASQQNVSCFFWPGSEKRHQQGASGADLEDQQPSYQLAEFRKSIPLQKVQS